MRRFAVIFGALATAAGFALLAVSPASAQDVPDMPAYETHAVYEGYAVVLAKLSGLDSMRERMSNRNYADISETGFWADWQAARATLTPDAAVAGSSYEVRNTVFNIGVDTPVSDAFLFGASLSLTQADAQISSPPTNKGDIDLEGFVLTAAATWFAGERQRDSGLYVDGQLRYASWEGDLKSGEMALTSKNEAAAIGLAAELGYRLPVGAAGLAVAPQVQLAWTNVDFDDFTAATGAGDTPAAAPVEGKVALGAGDILAARIGFALDREWSQRDEEGHFYGSANLRLPMDGETVTNVAGEALTTQSEEISLDFAGGVSWAWGESHALVAEAGTAQGDEVEEYRGSLGIRFRF